MLQRNVNVGADFLVGGDGFQQAAGDLVGIGVEEAYPAQSLDCRELLQQQRQAVFQAKIFAITGGVLANQRDLAHSASASRSASATTDSKRRERNLPRSCGMMQKLQG